MTLQDFLNEMTPHMGGNNANDFANDFFSQWYLVDYYGWQGLAYVYTTKPTTPLAVWAVARLWAEGQKPTNYLAPALALELHSKPR